MKIGLAFSGGGYRATAYSLGTLSYLNSIKILNDKKEEITMLRAVDALSTVSGGSITGMTYMKAQQEGVDFQTYESGMIKFMLDEDLVTQAVNNLVDPDIPNSLIEGIGKVYDQKLFQGQTLDKLMPSGNCSTEHVNYLSVNATDFNVGIPFRFVFQAPQIATKKDMIIGNGFNRITKDIVNTIPLYIPLAASSCFPGGFEPIQLHNKNGVVMTDEHGHPISLMDGGISDNQGIDALLRYDNNLSSKAKDARKHLDLMIITDVSTANITPFSPCKESPVPLIGNMKMISLFYLVLIANLLTIVAYFLPFVNSKAYLLTLNTIATTILTFLSIVLIIGKSVVTKLAAASVGKGKIVNLNKLTPNSTLVLMKNRVDSLSLLFGSIFMKNLRSKNYEEMYGSGKNAFRAVNSSVDFFLKKQLVLLNKLVMEADEENEDVNKTVSTKFKNPELSLKEHDHIFKIAYQATNMSTTLWMPNLILDYETYKNNLLNKKSEEVREITIDPSDLLREVTSCGHITMCYNIIDKCNFKFNRNSSNAVWPVIYDQAMKHWKAFERNPYWMYDKESLPEDIAAMDFTQIIKLNKVPEMA